MSSTNFPTDKNSSKLLDLIIIGAGPAGLSTALHLLQMDPNWRERMLIIEKYAHPREKLCGGGVTRLGLRILRDLDFKLPLSIPQAPVKDVQLIYGNRTIHVRGNPQFVVYNRAELDAYIAEQTKQRGAVINENETVVEIENEAKGVTVITDKGKYHAKTVVGADGAKGFTRRYFKSKSQNSRIARLLEVITAASRDAHHFQKSSAIFDFTPVKNDLQGYFWEFPSWRGNKPVLNLGVYDARIASRRPKARLLEVFQAGLLRLGKNPNTIKPKGHPIHLFRPANHFSIQRMLLVGDALGADPLFGEGIGPALGSGRIAAQTIQQAFNRDDFSYHNYRRRVLGSTVGRYLVIRWLGACCAYHLCHWPGFMRLLWRAGKLAADSWPKPSKMW